MATYTADLASNGWYSSQNLTGSAPTASTEGVPLYDFSGITVVVEANSGQTLSGAGTLKCWIYDPLVAGWIRVPGLDLTVGTASVRRLGFEAELLSGRRDMRVEFVPDSVTVSSGTTVRVYILGGTPFA